MESSSPTGKSVISRDLILVQFTCSVEKHSSIRWTAVKDVVFLHLGTRSRKTTTARHRKIGFPGALWPPQSFFWSKAGWRALLLCLCANHCSLSVTQPPAPDPSNRGKHKEKWTGRQNKTSETCISQNQFFCMTASPKAGPRAAPRAGFLWNVCFAGEEVQLPEPFAKILFWGGGHYFWKKLPLRCHRLHKHNWLNPSGPTQPLAPHEQNQTDTFWKNIIPGVFWKDVWRFSPKVCLSSGLCS